MQYKPYFLVIKYMQYEWNKEKMALHYSIESNLPLIWKVSEQKMIKMLQEKIEGSMEGQQCIFSPEQLSPCEVCHCNQVFPIQAAPWQQGAFLRESSRVH